MHSLVEISVVRLPGGGSPWRPWLGETSGNTPPEVEEANQPNSPPERAQ
eukprot:COSAG02_NODE_6300_length_3669_cov_2.392437_3_plen_49_part_00